MSVFELWLKGCEENGTLVYLLDGSRDSALYKLTRAVRVNNTYYWETPVFIGWLNGKQVCATTNYVAAYHIWRNAVNAVK